MQMSGLIRLYCNNRWNPQCLFVL